MEQYSLASLVGIAQSYDVEKSQAAIKEIERRGFTFEELYEDFNS